MLFASNIFVDISILRDVIHSMINMFTMDDTTITTLYPFNSLFSRTAWVSQYQKGKTSLDLNRARVDGVLGLQWHQLVHVPTVCTALETDNHTNNPSFNFYSLDALPDAQPTVSKHRRLFMIMF